MPGSDSRTALERFIRWVMRDTLYLAQYECEVQGQAEDYTLDLLPADERIRGTGLSNVPIRHGLPGVTVRVPVGASVLLGFEGGDPRSPFASLWDPDSIDAIEFNGGKSPVARVGDTATVAFPPLVTITGVGTLGAAPFTFSGCQGAIVSPGVAVIETGAKRAKA